MAELPSTTKEAPERSVYRVRHEIRLRLLDVVLVDRLTPNMVRVTLAGDELAGFLSPGFDDHVKLIFPAPGADAPLMPHLGRNGLEMPEGQARPIARDYTPRHYDPSTQRLQIDFALHESGPASDWARQTKPGQKLGVAGPRGSQLIPLNFDWYLLIGDETALPAIARRLAELPPKSHVQVIVEVEGPNDELLLETAAHSSIRWVHRNGELAGSEVALAAAVRQLNLMDGDFHVWIACESSVARSLRKQVIADFGVNPKWIKAAGYWARNSVGVHHHHDE